MAKASLLVIFSAAVLFGASEIGGAESEQPIARLASTRRYGSTNVDEIAAAGVAAIIARESNLVVADSVTNLADSLAVQVQLAGTDTEPYLKNPNQIATGAKTRSDITEYTVVSGDTISSIAQKFNITSDTIRWSNNLLGNSVAVGKKLRILPVSGVEHIVVVGDTADTLAATYKTSSSAVISFNDAELNGFKTGEKIIVPGGIRPATPAYYGYPSGYKLVYGGNGYTYGYCTWHAANRRAAIGSPVPRGLGNAVTWYARSSAGGLSVGTEPRVGAVVWSKNSYYIAGGDGHVGFVEKANGDGTFWVSDMNSSGYASMDVNSGPAGGWNRVSYRLLTSDIIDKYLYIY